MEGRQKEPVYKRLEEQVLHMDLSSEGKSQACMYPEVKEYFEGFDDQVSDIHLLGEGTDSTVYTAKLKGFKDRTQLVKVYDKLKQKLKNKDDLVPELKKYYRIMGDVRQYLEKDKNPLHKKITIGNTEYTPQFSVAQNGILVEKNGQIGSWVRDWVPGKNFDSGMSEVSGRWKIEDYKNEVCRYLSEKFGYKINPCAMNYKVSVDHEEKIIFINFTDLADSISDFVGSVTHEKYQL